MKTHTRILAIPGILVLALVASSSADSIKLIASVPFEFMVGNATLARGVYRVSRGDSTTTLMLRGDRNGAIVMGQTAASRDNTEQPKLVFHRVGGQYFLREVRFLGNSGLDLPETPSERQAAERIASGAPMGVQRVEVPLATGR
jgi:hypothetical protein